MDFSDPFTVKFVALMTTLGVYILSTVIIVEVSRRGYERRAPSVRLEGRGFVYRATIGVLLCTHDWLARSIEPVLGLFEPEPPTSTPLPIHVTLRAASSEPSHGASPSPVAIVSVPTTETTTDEPDEDYDFDYPIEPVYRDEYGVVIPYTRDGEQPLRLENGTYIILRNGA